MQFLTCPSLLVESVCCLQFLHADRSNQAATGESQSVLMDRATEAASNADGDKEQREEAAHGLSIQRRTAPHVAATTNGLNIEGFAVIAVVVVESGLPAINTNAVLCPRKQAPADMTNNFASGFLAVFASNEPAGKAILGIGLAICRDSTPKAGNFGHSNYPRFGFQASEDSTLDHLEVHQSGLRNRTLFAGLGIYAEPLRHGLGLDLAQLGNLYGSAERVDDCC